MEEDINENNILKFVNKWENRTIKSYVKSGEIPKENNEDVLIIVGNTFEKEVTPPSFSLRSICSSTVSSRGC